MHYKRYNPIPMAVLLVAALLWLLPHQALAQESVVEAARAGLQATPHELTLTAPQAPAKANATLTFYSSSAVFDAAFPGLPLEDFEEGNVGPGGVVGCPAPLDETNSDFCFSPGDILPGISFQDDPGPDTIDGIALIGAGFSGASSKNIVANTFVDAFVIDFTGPDDVFAAGMDLTSYFSNSTCAIDIYGPGGLLGSTTAPCTNAGSFWGVSSDLDPIVQLVIFSTSNQAEGVDNVRFGGLQEADLWVEKDVDVNFDTNPPTGSYHIHVQNHGPADATNVFVQDGLSSALTVLDWQETQGTFDPFFGGWTVGDLAAGAEAELWIDVRFDATGEYCNLAWAEADEDDPDPSNNNVELCILLQGEREAPDFVAGQGPGRIIERGGSRFFADLALTKTVDDATPSVGENVTYTLTVTNLGPQSTARVEVTDHLPECLALVGTDPAGVYDNWFWSVGKLRVGESKTLKITATVTAACQGTVTNFAEVTASSLPDPDDRFRGFRDPPEQDEEAEASFTVSAAASKASSQPRLLRNYPNPFNPETVVPFELVERTAVSLKVYDLLGRLVETLVEGELSAGVHEVIFRAGELPTGVYLVRLEAGGWVSTQRMTLMK